MPLALIMLGEVVAEVEAVVVKVAVLLPTMLAVVPSPSPLATQIKHLL